MSQKSSFENVNLGPDCEIAPNVQLGYQYKGWKHPTKIGKLGRVHSGTVIYADTEIGSRFTCGHNVVIRAECNIGDRVVILHGTTLEGKITIGKGVKIMAHVYIPSGTVIGGMTFIGPAVNFLNAKLPMRDTNVSAPKIGNHVVIGGGVTIGPGVQIGDNVFIGAGATVLEDVPPNSLAYGTPAKYKPLPSKFGRGNDPAQIFSGLDLWHPVEDDESWKEEDFPGKEEWLKDQYE